MDGILDRTAIHGMPGLAPVIRTAPFGVEMEHLGIFGGHQITRCNHKDGVPVPLHLHRHRPEMFVVLSGTYEFTVGEEKRTLKAGDVLSVEANTPHGFVAVGGDASLIEFSLDGAHYFKAIHALGKPENFPGGPDAFYAKVAEISAAFNTEFLPQE